MDVNPAIMDALGPGQERHYVFPVYGNGQFRYCLTEIRETDQVTCDVSVYRIYEAFTQSELDWLNENSRPHGCGHDLVSDIYWLNPIAYDLLERFRADMKRERDPFDGIDTDKLRADLDMTLNAILGR